MSKVYANIFELVGNTPLVVYNNFGKKINAKGNIIGKLEYYNPSGSIKDRIAKNMIEAAEKVGKLNPGGTIIEGTSGNTGIGLAAIAAAKGYKTILVMPDNMSHERISILKGYGAEVILTPAAENIGGANAKAAELLEKIDNSFMPSQGANPDNPKTHRNSTGPEIWNDLDGKVDVFVASVGTGGTISGVGAYLKEKNPNIHIVAVEPAGCPVLSGGEPGEHKIQGIGGGAITPVCDVDIFDKIITVSDEDAFKTASDSAKLEGISVGISSGAALWAASILAKREEFDGKNIVVILPDSGERYLSSGIYGD